VIALARPERVKALVYVTALAPDVNRQLIGTPIGIQKGPL
jgi:hypothetical protein